MPENADHKTEPKRTIHHTDSGGHSVDREELLRSERVRQTIAEVAARLKVSRPGEPQRAASEPAS